MTFSEESNRLDAIASDYHQSNPLGDKDFDAYFQQLTLEWIQSYTNNSRSVLQMGYGEGFYAQNIAVKDSVMHLVEGSQSLASIASRVLAPRVVVHNQLFEEFDPPCSFDCILATNVLEHVVDPVLVLRRMKDWLLPGGRVFVTVPNASSLHRLLAVQMGIQKEIYDLSPRDHVVGHRRVYDADTLSFDCLQAGYQIESKRGFVLKVLPNSQQKLLPERLIRAMHDISPLIPAEIQANLGFVLVNGLT